MLREQGEQAGSKGSELAPQVYGSMHIRLHAYMAPCIYGSMHIRLHAYMVPRIYGATHIWRLTYTAPGEQRGVTSHLVKVSLPDIFFPMASIVITTF